MKAATAKRIAYAERKAYFCPLCAFKTPDRFGLAAHLYNEHSDDEAAMHLKDKE
jgi:hypothetical protein